MQIDINIFMLGKDRLINLTENFKTGDNYKLRHFGKLADQKIHLAYTLNEYFETGLY